MLRRIAQAIGWPISGAVSPATSKDVKASTATGLDVSRLPTVAASSAEERARISAGATDPALRELLESGFDARVADVRAGKPGFDGDARTGVFGQITRLTGAQRKSLRDILLFKPPHPQLGQMDRKDPAIKGPPDSLALMRIMSGALLGQTPEPGDYHKECADRVLDSLDVSDAVRSDRKSLLYEHQSVVRLAERYGPAAFNLVEQFGQDATDTLLQDSFHADVLLEVSLKNPQGVKQARAFLDAKGPAAFSQALTSMYSARYDAGFLGAPTVQKLGFEGAVQIAEVLAADRHGVRALRVLEPETNVLEIAAQGPQALKARLAEVGEKVVEFGSGGAPLMRGTTDWPPLEVAQSPQVKAAQSRLLKALGMHESVLADPSSASIKDVSKLVRAMRQQIHTADPDASKMLSRELSGRRFISRSYYDELYATGTGNPEHRYSKQTYDSWREADGFVRAAAKEDRGQPLTPTRVLDVLSGIHSRAGAGIVNVRESHLKEKDLGRLRTEDEDHVQMGKPFHDLAASDAAEIGKNPYLRPTSPMERDDGRVTRDITFAPGPDVPRLMDETAAWIVENEGKLPPEKLAAEAHFRLVSIHPFMDGNGRSSKLMVDYLLRRAGVEPPIWREGKILLKRDSWSGAVRKGVEFQLSTVQRYFDNTAAHTAS